MFFKNKVVEGVKKLEYTVILDNLREQYEGSKISERIESNFLFTKIIFSTPDGTVLTELTCYHKQKWFRRYNLDTVIDYNIRFNYVSYSAIFDSHRFFDICRTIKDAQGHSKTILMHDFYEK